MGSHFGVFKGQDFLAAVQVPDGGAVVFSRGDSTTIGSECDLCPDMLAANDACHSGARIPRLDKSRAPAYQSRAIRGECDTLNVISFGSMSRVLRPCHD